MIWRIDGGKVLDGVKGEDDGYESGKRKMIAHGSGVWVDEEE